MIAVRITHVAVSSSLVPSPRDWPLQYEREYHVPIGRSGSCDACRNAAIQSLTGVKRKSKPAPKMSQSTQNDTLRPPNVALQKPYSITSSAIESMSRGISMPSARAVCRLMTNSNLLNCSTGRSAGLVPLRILPV
jgi:hypothetical protein